MMLGVTVEPFGKDHATPGGSYETGERIVREVFGGEPPFPIPYEWIRLKGRGDMSSSKGNVLAIDYILDVVPPEALRYLVIRARPSKTINFDPGLPLLQLVDEIDDVNSRNRDERAVELSQAGGFRPVGIPFKHLVVVAQAAHFDEDEVMGVLARSGYAGADREAVTSRLGHARRWLDRFAPEEMRFAVCEELPAVAAELSEDQRAFLARLADELSDEMSGEEIHKLVYGLAVDFESTKPAELFQAIYLSLLGKTRGPRAGAFITVLGPDFCAERFRQAATQGGSAA
jgi:lysyl-tRNA synthetase class 1